MRHELKVWPQFFAELERNAKTFEVRRDDRGFLVGDMLTLNEWDPSTGQYTGKACTRRVTYLMRGPAFGVEDGFVVMAVKP